MNARRIFLACATLASMAVFGASSASAQGRQFSAVLLGGHEINPSTNQPVNAAGSGIASVIIVPTPAGAPLRLCFSILVEGLASPPSAAHIHENFAGRNAPALIGLATPNGANPGFSAGCPTLVNNATNQGILARLRSTPNRFYVNVHTTGLPNGAIRGQLQ
jgi:Cu/Zn superoxide dismutase